jgi:hypothetical protein
MPGQRFGELGPAARVLVLELNPGPPDRVPLGDLSRPSTAAVQRMAGAWPNAQPIHLPAHAPVAGPAEIYFSIVPHKALIPTGLDQIRDCLGELETATTSSPGRSLGGSPTPTPATCCAESTPATRPTPMPWQPDHYGLRRPYRSDHLGAARVVRRWRGALRGVTATAALATTAETEQPTGQEAATAVRP